MDDAQEGAVLGAGPPDVVDAARRIGPHIRHTPLLRTTYHGAPLTLKLEYLQHTGSFKARGAVNAIARMGIRAGPGVIAASGGNHGLGIAYAGRRLGVPTRIVVLTTVPVAKAAALDRLGATVVRYGHEYADAEDHARALSASLGVPFIHPFEHPDVIAGQGTVAHEILADAGPDLDAIVVGVGGGGLLAGVCCAIAPETDVTIWGVEPDGAATMATAVAAGRPVPVAIDSIAASSLGARMTSELNLSLCRDARLARVTDADVLAAQRTLWEDFRILVEPGGAAALAAVLTGAIDARNPCVVLCGANTFVDLAAAR